MSGMSKVSFVVRPLSTDEPVPSIVPAINGVTLTELVALFEHARHYDPAGGYAGLVPGFFRLGPLKDYFMGISTDPIYSNRGYWLLGCGCGEVGCWPLEARIVTHGRQISWEQFKQPFRPERDYSAFGPFIFDIEQYRSAVDELNSTFRE